METAAAATGITVDVAADAAIPLEQTTDVAADAAIPPGPTPVVAVAILPGPTMAVDVDAIATEITADAATVVHSAPATKRAGV